MDDEILAVYYLECALFLSSFLLMRHDTSKINRTTRINNLVVFCERQFSKTVL